MNASPVPSASDVDTINITTNSRANPISWLDTESCQTCGDSTLRFSPNATASDLIGPGRTLGKLFKSAGKKIESSLGRIAERAGYGPRQISYQIEGALLRHGSNIVLPEDEPNIMRLCENLLGYTQYVPCT